MKVLKFNEATNNPLHLTKIADMMDNYLNVPYTLNTCSAKELSNYLKVNVKKRNLDLDSFNDEKKSVSYLDKEANQKSEKNPPLEIYEYQPFFLMEDEKGEYFLCDGFKRLLWYTAPEHSIQVRVYKKNQMTDGKILKMLVNLNHFKFFGGLGKYYDRGFSLLLKIVFDLTIQKYKDAFDGYLSKNEIAKSYSRENVRSVQKNESVKDRILNPLFISDTRFIEEITNNPMTMNNTFLGVLTYSFRKAFPDKNFDSTVFLKLQSENAVLLDLLKSYEKYGDTDSEFSRKTINKIIPLYSNIFNKMLGVETEETYAEKIVRAKKLVQTMKKEKDWINLTGVRNKYEIETKIDEYVKLHKKSPKVKIVVHPNQDEKSNILPVGIYDFKFKGYKKSTSVLSSRPEYIFGSLDGTIEVGGSKMSNYHSSPTYSEIREVNGKEFGKRNDIDLFISFN